MLRTIEVNKEVTEELLTTVLGSMVASDENYEEVKSEESTKIDPATGVKSTAGKIIGVYSKDRNRNFAVSLPMAPPIEGVHKLPIQWYIWKGTTEFNETATTEDARLVAINEFATALKAALEA